MLNMSVVHRAMLEDFRRMRRTLGINVEVRISYSQLNRVIEDIDCESFNLINDSYF